ncbi:hypothetical protein BH10ACI2_BH10ACI2_19960 [soil metagenome]
MLKKKLTKTKQFIAGISLIIFASVMIAGNKTAFSSTATPETTRGVFVDSGSDYSTHCSICHGDDGHAKTPKGRKSGATDLAKSDVTDTKGIRISTNGRGEMSGFKDKLTADQIGGLMAYVHGFRR